VTWTTDVPSTSWVEFGPTTAYGLQTPIDPSLLTTHSVVLDGLQPGTIYHFRANSATAAGPPGMSVDGTFTTAAAGTGPDVLGLSVRQVTSTTALMDWTSPTGNVAQVEYGPTANYSSFTLLQVFSTQAQEMALTNLTPKTQYHLRVKAWDGAGSLAASPDLTFSTATAGLATLIGSQTVQPAPVIVPPGRAAAYQYVASQSGLASRVRVYVDDGSTSTLLRAGLYADQAGAPGAMLAQGSIIPAPGWNTIALSPTFVLGGGRYWVAVLSPSGALATRQATSGGSSQLSLQNTLAAFPATWTASLASIASLASAASPLAAYVQQIPPSVTIVGPNEGSTVSGSVQLSAVVDDDTPVTLVQFLVDNVPVGAATRTPFTSTWDSSTVGANAPHILTARATDALGRSANSAFVTISVETRPAVTTPPASPEPGGF
jgi:Bacterial Ig domain/Fibronectin type III domain